MIQQYAALAIIGFTLLSAVGVGLIGLGVGLLGRLLSRQALHLAIGGAYTGSIPGGLIGYSLAVQADPTSPGFFLACVGGVMGAGVGSVLGVLFGVWRDRYHRRQRRQELAKRQASAE